MKTNTIIKILLSLTIILIIISIIIFLDTQPSSINQEQDNTVSKDMTDTTINGVSFTYPNSINTKYVNLIDWPPQIQVAKGKYVCNIAGQETVRESKTEEVFIGGSTYCKTSSKEGAAGSTYTQYAYMMSKENTNIIFTFSTREVQCYNYDNPQQTECLNEQKSFNVDSLFDKLAQSTVIQK